LAVGAAILIFAYSYFTVNFSAWQIAEMDSAHQNTLEKISAHFFLKCLPFFKQLQFPRMALVYMTAR